MSEIAIPIKDDLVLTGLRLETPTQVNRSAWTGTRKVVGLAGAELWSGSVAVNLITTENEEREWRAFLFALGGPANSFRYYLPCNTHIGLRPVVASDPGDAYTLGLKGMQENARILKAGQFMTVPLPSGHERAVMLTADLRTDGTGAATAEFRPALGEPPAVGATVETVNPFIPMSPTSSNLGLATENGISSFAFDVEEAR